MVAVCTAANAGIRRRQLQDDLLPAVRRHGQHLCRQLQDLAIDGVERKGNRTEAARRVDRQAPTADRPVSEGIVGSAATPGVPSTAQLGTVARQFTGVQIARMTSKAHASQHHRRRQATARHPSQHVAMPVTDEEPDLPQVTVRARRQFEIQRSGAGRHAIALDIADEQSAGRRDSGFRPLTANRAVAIVGEAAPHAEAETGIAGARIGSDGREPFERHLHAQLARSIVKFVRQQKDVAFAARDETFERAVPNAPVLERVRPDFRPGEGPIEQSAPLTLVSSRTGIAHAANQPACAMPAQESWMISSFHRNTAKTNQTAPGSPTCQGARARARP